MIRQVILVSIIIFAAFLAFRWISSDQLTSAMLVDEHGHAVVGEGVEEMKGPKGGRLLESGDFSVEITIFEQGIEPEFRVYSYWGEQALKPQVIELEVDLLRTGDRLDNISFTPQANYLRSDVSVEEPHSFDVIVSAKYQDKAYQWSYQTLEGRTEIPHEMASEAGVETERAGSAVIRETLVLTGRVQSDPNLLSRVRPRFPGVVEQVTVNLGEEVRAGQVLALIQSNESLQTYQVKAPIDGLIVRRDIQVGESTGDKILFIIEDLSRVWVELDVFASDLSRVAVGQPAEVETFDDFKMQGSIEWVSPLAAHASQSVSIRVPLDNPEGHLRPGQFVRGTVTIQEHKVDLAVRQTALQAFRNFQVVFAQFDETYEVRMLKLGMGDDTWVEVLDGLAPGTEYVVSNSYLIKADIEKSGASHDH
jgi:cobalt-zinc-cadmium efflux system membrane fusion protein